MTEPTSPEQDLRDELSSLVASARALLEQHEASGAAGMIIEDAALAAAFLAGAPAASGGPRPRDFRPSVTPGDAPARPAFQPPSAAQRPVAQRPAPPPAEAAPARFMPPAEAAPARFTPPAQPVPRDARPAPPREPPAQPPPPRQEAPRAAAPPAGPEADDRRMHLALLAEQVRPCTKCPLCEGRKQTVFARGNPFAEVCFVGEGPGADEDDQGEPFVGRAGQLLDRMIAAMGYKRDDVYICNVVKCRPPSNRKPEPAEMDACMPYLREQLALVRPKVIVALGATAAAALLGSSEGITRLRGKWKLYRGTTPVMPTFHPSYLLRDPSKKRDAWNDLQEVMKHLGKPVPRAGADGGRGDE